MTSAQRRSATASASQPPSRPRTPCTLVRAYDLTLHPWSPPAHHGPCTLGGPTPFPAYVHDRDVDRSDVPQKMTTVLVQYMGRRWKASGRSYAVGCARSEAYRQRNSCLPWGASRVCITSASVGQGCWVRSLRDWSPKTLESHMRVHRHEMRRACAAVRRVSYICG